MTYDELYRQAETIGKKLDMLPQDDPRRKQLQDQMGAITSQMATAGQATAPVAEAPAVPAGAAAAAEAPAPEEDLPTFSMSTGEVSEATPAAVPDAPAAPEQEELPEFSASAEEDMDDPGIANSRDYMVMGKKRSEFDGVAQGLLDTGFDLVSGLNKRIAQVAGVGLDTVDAAWRLMSEDGLLENPGDGAAAMQRAFGTLGISTAAPHTLSREVGKAMFDNLAVLGAAFMAAPTLAASGAQAGAGVGKQIVGNMATALRANPAVAVGSEVGASIGGPVGEDLGGPLGGMAGSLIGGGIGGSTMGRGMADIGGGIVGGMTGTAVGLPLLGPMGSVGFGAAGVTVGRRVGRKVAEGLLSRRGAPTTPMLSNDPPEVAAAYAQQATAGLRAQASQEIEDAITAVGGVNDPERAAGLLHRTISRAYDKAQQKANILWKRVDKSLGVDPTNTQMMADEMVANAGRFGTDALPGDIIAKINKLLPLEDDGPIEVIPTVKDLLDIRASIEGLLRAGVDHAPLKANLTALSKSLMDDIVLSYPNDRDLRAARDYTRWIHDQFTRGPVGDFLGKEQGIKRTLKHPTRQALQMLTSEKAQGQLNNIRTEIDIPSLERTYAAMIQAKFKQEAFDLGPEAGRKFLEKPEINRIMRAFPKVAARHAEATNRLADALANQKQIEDSAFIRFADEDVQTAMNSVLNGGNKVSRAKEITDALSKDESGLALKAFQNGLVTRLFNLGGSRPQQISYLLQSRDFQPLYMAVLGPEKMARLNRILDAGITLQAGGPKSPQQRAVSLLARYLGAGVARNVGANTIQQTGTAASMSELMFNAISGRMHLPELVARALHDPKMERQLYKQVPSNIVEIQKDADAVRGIASAISASRYSVDAVKDRWEEKE